MPTYAYACKDCGHAFDAVQSFSDDSLTDCPACDGLLRKQYGSIGVTFNGSGFYRTDSRDSTTTSTASADGGASTPGSASSSSAASSTAAASTGE